MLSILLMDLKDVLPHRDVPDDRSKELRSVQDQCQQLFEDLEQKLDRYVALDGKGVSKREMMSKMWKRVRWDQTEILEYRNRCQRCIDGFSAHLTFLNRLVGSARYIPTR